MRKRAVLVVTVLMVIFMNVAVGLAYADANPFRVGAGWEGGFESRDVRASGGARVSLIIIKVSAMEARVRYTQNGETPSCWRFALAPDTPEYPAVINEKSITVKFPDGDVTFNLTEGGGLHYFGGRYDINLHPKK